MPLTRRQFTKASAAAIAGAACVGPLTGRLLAQGPQPVKWRRLSKSARVIEGMGGNALVLVSGKEALLVDTKVAVAGGLTRGLIEAADFNVTQVINTHHHADHTGGNANWTTDTPVLAHELATQRILDQHKRYETSIHRRYPDKVIAPPERFAPTDTVAGDSELTMGEQKIILRYFGPGHTDNDIAVHIPGENILHTGDLFFNKMHIFIDLPGGATTKGWLMNVEELIKLCDVDTVVIPGHGPVTTVRGLEKQRDYIRQLREIVTKAVKDGKSREETIRLPMPGTEKYTGSQRGLMSALSVTYVEMTGGGAE